MEISIFNENYVLPNSLRAWFLAARPKTLSGAAVPVMIGTAYAWQEHSHSSVSGIAGNDLLTQLSTFHWIPAILCLLFAFIMQIDANFVNDYFDCVRGKDTEERLGPKRACMQGWITLPAMRWGMTVTTLLACIVGTPLLYYGGIEMLWVGLACIVFCFLYTTVFSSLGLGDLLVLVFFGIVPVCGTYWATIPHPIVTESLIPAIPSYPFHLPLSVIGISIACGLVVDTLLIVNNYRDIETDRKVGKKTLVVLIGKKYTEKLYLYLVAIALCIDLSCYGWTPTNMILTFGAYLLYIGSWNKLRMISKGKELNKVLGLTARNIFIYGILTSVMILLS